MALNARHRLFVAAYVDTRNITKAAIAAGCPKAGAHVTGSRWFKNAKIKAEIEKAINALTEKSIRRARDRGITKERWLQELSTVGFSNIDDHIRIVKREIKQGIDGDSLFVTDVEPVPTEERGARKGRAVKKIGVNKHGVVIELHSKQAALETIGKHYGWVKSDGVVVNNQITTVDPKELAKALKAVEEDL